MGAGIDVAVELNFLVAVEMDVAGAGACSLKNPVEFSDEFRFGISFGGGHGSAIENIDFSGAEAAEPV